MKKKRILITGSEGFIGSSVSDKLVEEALKSQCNCEIVFLDKKIPNTANKLIKHYEDFTTQITLKLFQKDLTDKDLYSEIGSFDAILHLAGLIDATESIAESATYYKNNLEATINLLQCISKGGKFIFASSAAVYGIPNKAPSSELDDIRPITPYGETKVSAEKEIINYKSKNDLNYYILRFFNIAGSYSGKVIKSNPSCETNLFSQIKNKYLNNENFIIDGANYVTKDGTCERDFVEIKWLCSFLSKLILNSLNKNSFIVNVGCGKPISILQLANALSKINGEFNFKIGQPRQVEIPTSYADIRKLLVILQSLNQSSPPSNVNQIAKSIRIEES